MTLIGLPPITSREMYDPEANRPTKSFVYIHLWIRHGLGKLINAIKDVFREKIKSSDALQRAIPQMSTENVRRLTNNELLLLNDLPFSENTVVHMARLIQGFFIIEDGKIVRIRKSDEISCNYLLSKLEKRLVVNLFNRNENCDVLLIKFHNAIFSNKLHVQGVPDGIKETFNKMTLDERILFIKNGAELALKAKQVKAVIDELNCKKMAKLWESVVHIYSEFSRKYEDESQGQLQHMKLEEAVNPLLTEARRRPRLLSLTLLSQEHRKKYIEFLTSCVDKTSFAILLKESLYEIAYHEDQAKEIANEVLASIKNVPFFTINENELHKVNDNLDATIVAFKREHPSNPHMDQIDRFVSQIKALTEVGKP